MFKNVKWLPTIDLGNKKIVKEYEEVTFKTSMRPIYYDSYLEKRKYVHYVNKGLVNIAQPREVKYTPTNETVQRRKII